MLSALAFWAAALSGGDARSSEILPTYSLRHLAADAVQVIEALPLERLATKATLRFQVLSILRGEAYKVDEAVRISRLDLYSFTLGVESEKLPEIERVLLFLAVPEDGKVPNELVLSGIRLLVRDGRVLRPNQFNNPGPYEFETVPNLAWEELLKRARNHLKAVDEVRALFRLKDAAERNRKLFEWIEAHRTEFRMESGDPDDARQRWFPLDHDVFGEILKSRVLDDCWRAVALHHELHDRNPAAMAEFGSFASPAGRAFLLEILRGERRTLLEHRRAIGLLADERTLWPSPPEGHPRPEELTEIRGAFEVFLVHADLQLKESSVQGLLYASRKGRFASEHSTDSLPPLTRAYEKEPPGYLRNRMAACVRRVGGVDHWKKVSGNERGTLVVINQHGLEKGTAWFGVYFESATASSYESPVLALEKLDARGQPSRSLELHPTLQYSALPLDQGWGRNQARFQCPLDRLEAGQWRARFRGTIGRANDKVPWTSEPVDFEVK